MIALRFPKRIYSALLAAILCTVTFFTDQSHAGVVETLSTIEHTYESLLFDTTLVHSIDIEMEDWQGFLDGCTDEAYVECNLTIDGETYQNVAIRAKGNTSLTQVEQYGNDRYSFKVEFDHYNEACRYHGLDKLSLNNIIQDNTYMKDYLTYQMMQYFGVASPLCSFVYITANGEDWGLYLAVEGVEDAFLTRNYGTNPGCLYKPDSMKMGGGKGFGGDFRMSEWNADTQQDAESMEPPKDMPQPPEGFDPENGGMPPGKQGETQPESDSKGPGQGGFAHEGGNRGPGQGGPGAMGSDDVTLIYTDDSYESYQNIFDNAKTTLTDTDKDRLIDALESLNAGADLEDTVDTLQVIRYFVVHNFVCNFDSYTGSMIHNYYLYEDNGQLSMIPWDYNLAFGGFENATDAEALVNYPIDSPVSGGDTDSRPMLAWIFADEAYTAQYHQAFDDFIASFFESGTFAETIDTVQTLIAPYVEKDPTKFCTYEEFTSGVSTLKDFCLLRAESIRGQLDGSIPATADEQAAASDTLVDASAVTISAMGSMGHENGPMRQGKSTMGHEHDPMDPNVSPRRP